MSMSSKTPKEIVPPSTDKVSTPIPKIFTDHPTYQRVLEALIDPDALSDEQIQKLPQEAHGLSAERKTLIELIKQSSSSAHQVSLLLDLRYRFGLPHDLEILYLCLTLDQEHLTIDALNQLQHHLSKSLDLGAWNQRLTDRLQFLEIRSFNPRIQSLAAFCLNQLKNKI